MSSNTDSIILTDLKDFNIRHILDCGQIFRYFLLPDGRYEVYSDDKRCFVQETDDKAVITFDEGNKEYFYRFFDLATDYSAIKSRLKDKPLLNEAVEYGYGIRILNQNKWETLISFIISANNHIPRIKGIIRRLCDALGRDMGGYHAFPEVEALADADEKFFASVGAGYRAPYLKRTAEALLKEDFAEWQKLPTEELRARLTALHGVGRKVADCVLLFGFNRFDVFPVDTWIRKVFAPYYGDMPAEKLSGTLVGKYGELSGFVQQWLFYYKREEKNSAKA